MHTAKRLLLEDWKVLVVWGFGWCGCLPLLYLKTRLWFTSDPRPEWPYPWS